jgi:hypothetical protein
VRLAIVIVNYKTAALVADCLHSLAATCSPTPPTTIIVDNNSPDDSLTAIASTIASRGYAPWCSLLPAERNGGFAYGNNVGLRVLLASPTPPDAVLLLNPDTIVRPGAIGSLEVALTDYPDDAIFGSRLEDPDATPQRSAFRFHSALGELDAAVRLGLLSRVLSPWVVAPPVRDDTHRADWLSGASLLIRKSVFDAIGLLDDHYFMYYEETDFCRRARRTGFTCRYLPQSRVVHLVGQASGVVHGRPKRRPDWWFDARRRYFIQNCGRPHAILADLAWFLGSPLFHAKRIILRRPNPDPEHFLADLWRYGAIRNGLARKGQLR